MGGSCGTVSAAHSLHVSVLIQELLNVCIIIDRAHNNQQIEYVALNKLYTVTIQVHHVYIIAH